MARVSAERRAFVERWAKVCDMPVVADLLADLADAEARAERAEGALSRIADWTREHGAALKPTAGSADSFGDGMREAKRQVGQLVTATWWGKDGE